MKINQTILTNNPCYKEGKKITVKGLMLHSVGCPQPSAKVFVNSWNKADYSRACVHAFIDANSGEVYQTLPWNHRGWHCGGKGNDTHIGVEMCEPATADKAAVQRTYDTAVLLFARLCKKYKLDPLASGVIVSHSEGHKRGIASNHADPEYLWGKLNMGYTMDRFRKAVKAAMLDAVLYRVQVGAYRRKANADAQLAKVKNAGFDAFIVKVGDLYKVQVGAFSKKANATAQVARLKKLGISAFVTK